MTVQIWAGGAQKSGDAMHVGRVHTVVRCQYWTLVPYVRGGGSHSERAVSGRRSARRPVVNKLRCNVVSHSARSVTAAMEAGIAGSCLRQLR
jgi:hypothetical protein